MNHFLAYGNSDQASFRDPAVRAALNYMTVPGTIAAYYPDATAAFVLSSELDYMIDPRTPLFQDEIDSPRASHYSLAHCLGPSVEARIGEAGSGAAAHFPASFYTDEVVGEVVTEFLAFQRGYGSRADDIQEKLDRYRRLLAAAGGSSRDRLVPTEQRPPAMLLAPYFVARRLGDDWWEVNERIWAACSANVSGTAISPVLAIENVAELEEGVASLSGRLSDRLFFWVANLDERRAAIQNLEILWRAVESTTQKSLINLYGGFFSILLHYVGGWGFNNGLGYSESRNWPELSATGAAPARYYMSHLHMFLPARQAQQVMDADPYFECDCSTCQARGGILELGYHELKRHFAESRRREIEWVTASSRSDVATQLREVRERFDTVVRPILPERLSTQVEFLDRWALILETA